MSILYPWVESLGLRHQGVILAAVRGCDGESKESASKQINRMIRNICLVPFDVRELSNMQSFMSYDYKNFFVDINNFEAAKDEYPVHYFMHVLNAIEIIAYNHPDEAMKTKYLFAYTYLVESLHLHIETKEEQDTRLNRDKIGQKAK